MSAPNPISDDAEFEEQNDEEMLEEDGPESEIEINWENHSQKYEVVSQGEAGFDRVTRPDYTSAKDAAETHKEATGNECEINLL